MSSTTAQLDPEKTARPRERVVQFPLLKTGSIVGGRFLISGRLGAGAMGAVYRARDLGRGLEAAIKVTSIATPSQESRFRRSVEVREPSLGPFHGSILPLWGHGKTSTGLGYLVAPRLSPIGLDQRISRAHGHSFDTVADVLGPMAGALSCLHERGWIHRDLKPSNILLDAKDRPFLIDYGLAKKFGNGKPDSGRFLADEVTAPGSICGTPFYMSNQRLMGVPGDPSDDTFSLALTFVEYLEGTLPHGTKSRSVLTLQRQRELGIRIGVLNCPSVVTRLVRAALSPNRGDRPTASEFGLVLS